MLYDVFLDVLTVVVYGAIVAAIFGIPALLYFVFVGRRGKHDPTKSIWGRGGGWFLTLALVALEQELQRFLGERLDRGVVLDGQHPPPLMDGWVQAQ